MGQKGNKRNSADHDVEWGKDPDQGNNSSNAEAPSQPEHMKQFFNDVDAIKLDISAVTDATEHIVALKDKARIKQKSTDSTNLRLLNI